MDSLDWPFSRGNRIRYHETMSRYSIYKCLLDYAIRLRAGPGSSFCFGLDFDYMFNHCKSLMYGSPSADSFRIVWW